jgi:adenylate cyclase
MSEKFERKLAAIFHADVAGYSRLTGQDEEGTHRVLRQYLPLIAKKIEGHEGRVVHYAGDAVLAEFKTVSDALQCAVDAQKELHQRNAALDKSQRVPFRMGVNLGEVIVDPPEIYGEGVNVAARLEAIADPGGIAVSGCPLNLNPWANTK